MGCDGVHGRGTAMLYLDMIPIQFFPNTQFLVHSTKRPDQCVKSRVRHCHNKSILSTPTRRSQLLRAHLKCQRPRWHGAILYISVFCPVDKVVSCGGKGNGEMSGLFLRISARY